MISMKRFTLGASALVVAAALGTPSRADDAASKFKADLDKLSDRYSDPGTGGRIAAAIKLCKERIAAAGDDEGARLSLIRFELAKDDFDAAQSDADAAIEKLGKDSEGGKKAQVLKLMAQINAFQHKVRAEKTPDKQKELAEKLKPGVQEAEKAVLEAVGGKEAVQKIARAENQHVSQMKSLDLIGMAPKPITVKDTAGEAIEWKKYEGKVVLLDFWATWCGPCVAEMPNVLATYEKLHEKGFEVIGISLDQDRSKLDAYVKDNKIPWRQSFDGKGWKNEVAQAWGINSIPATYLIDHTGKVRFVGARGPALEKAVQELLDRAKK